MDTVCDIADYRKAVLQTAYEMYFHISVTSREVITFRLRCTKVLPQLVLGCILALGVLGLQLQRLGPIPGMKVTIVLNGVYTQQIYYIHTVVYILSTFQYLRTVSLWKIHTCPTR